MKKNLAVILFLCVFSASFAQELTPKDNEVLLRVFLTDSKKVPEGDALIKFKEMGGKLAIAGTTDSAGKLSMLLPQGKKFEVTCLKYGVTFKFDPTDVPNIGSPATLDFTMQIQIDTIYKNQYVLDNVYFDNGKATLKDGSFPALNVLLKAMQENTKMVIEIAGHTDNTGVAQKNIELSFARANSVRTYLISKGIQAGRVSAKGYGQTQPIASSDNEAGRAKNRRTEVRVIKE